MDACKYGKEKKMSAILNAYKKSSLIKTKLLFIFRKDKEKTLHFFFAMKNVVYSAFVPQTGQNTLPCGSSLWQFAQTWLGAGAAGCCGA